MDGWALPTKVIDEALANAEEVDNDGRESKLELSGKKRYLLDLIRFDLLASCDEFVFTFKFISLLFKRF